MNGRWRTGGQEMSFSQKGCTGKSDWGHVAEILLAPTEGLSKVPLLNGSCSCREVGEHPLEPNNLSRLHLQRIKFYKFVYLSFVSWHFFGLP